MKLDWQIFGSWGDTQWAADGTDGMWRVVTDGKWWVLSHQLKGVLASVQTGKFVDRERAMQFAQEREDGVQVIALALAVEPDQT